MGNSLSTRLTKASLTLVGMIMLIIGLTVDTPSANAQVAIDFGSNKVQNTPGGMFAITTLDWGPDDRLYVAGRFGGVWALTIERTGEDLYSVVAFETFNQINGKLAEVFPRLFNGGTAQLVLTEPDKPLETGVEFMVHPPGKKLTRLSLLSGGEKALSAIAFVFSIFLIRPTSFCIMDEIDAPLDDANVHRFNELLRMIGEQSQIIMITHKKKSMEFADTLFGVTMEKKGISKVVSVNLTTE